MYKLKSTDCIYIKNRGPLYTFENNQMPDEVYDPIALTGMKVEIDGKLFQVLGCERYAVIHGTRENPHRYNFGLLVKSYDLPKENISKQNPSGEESD